MLWKEREAEAGPQPIYPYPQEESGLAGPILIVETGIGRGGTNLPLHRGPERFLLPIAILDGLQAIGQSQAVLQEGGTNRIDHKGVSGQIQQERFHAQSLFG